MPLIELERLHPDPRNANVCAPDILDKLCKHIARTGLCPSLLVRPHPELPEQFILVDGHHRKLAVASLGWTEVECQISSMGEEEAGLLLLTLNRLRGTDIPRQRALLIDSLLVTFPLEEFSQLLPESSSEIEGLLGLLQQDNEALEKALLAQIAAEQESLPVPFGFMIPAQDAELVRQTLALHHPTDSAQALVLICQKAVSQEGGVHA